jgi:CxxC motif-containing protein (DUF1111 family)
MVSASERLSFYLPLLVATQSPSFFLHDGRTTDLLQAMTAHRSGNFFFFGTPSEANEVIEKFLQLGASDKQAILNFLRSL